MRAARLSLVVFVAAALVCGAAACSGSSHKAAPRATTTTIKSTSTATNGTVSIGIKLATLAPRSIAVGATASSNGALTIARNLVVRYLELASRDPLLRGPVSHDLSKLFTPAAAASVSTATSRAIADVGLGPVRKSTNIEGTLHLTTLVAADRRIAAIDATVQTVTFVDIAAGRFSVARGGELLLMPSGTKWVIAGYDLTVQRTALSTGATTTTKAAGGSTP